MGNSSSVPLEPWPNCRVNSARRLGLSSPFNGQYQTTSMRHDFDDVTGSLPMASDMSNMIIFSWSIIKHLGMNHLEDIPSYRESYPSTIIPDKPAQERIVSIWVWVKKHVETLGPLLLTSKYAGSYRCSSLANMGKNRFWSMFWSIPNVGLASQLFCLVGAFTCFFYTFNL